MDPSKVTVVIPTHNALELLRRTLASLELQQPDPRAFEVIVVDDGSSDGSAEWLKGYAGSLRLKAELLETNLGRASARNRGASRASGGLLLFLDGDMEFGPELVASHAAIHVGGELVVLGRVVYDRSLGRRGYARYIESRGAAKLPPGESLPGRYFLSGHVSMPRPLFLAVGGFDPRFQGHGGEDLDLGMRLVVYGARLIRAPDLVTTHLHIRGLREVVAAAREYGRRNIPQLVKAHPELYSQLRLDRADRKGAAGLMGRFLLSSPVYAAVFALTSLLNGLAAPAVTYDYLLFRNYNRGYRESV